MLSVTLIVTLSVVASGVRVIPVPAANSKVSVFVSAAIVVEPTLTLLNAFWLTSPPPATAFLTAASRAEKAEASVSPLLT